MKIAVAGLLVAAVMMGAAPPADAEEPRGVPAVFTPSRLEPFVRQAIEARPAVRRAQSTGARSPGRDSIWNGGLIGAAIGGVGGSALIVASRGGSDNIPRAMLNVCVPPALGGFAVGAIVDALR
jgi:hypothetical protein